MSPKSLLLTGRIPISEPELENKLKSVIENKTLFAQLKPTSADIFIIAVPTPHIKDNKFYYPDTSSVFKAVEYMSIP